MAYTNQIRRSALASTAQVVLAMTVSRSRELFISSFFCVTAFGSSSHNVLQTAAARAYGYGYEPESAHLLSDSRNLHQPTA